MEEDYLSLAPLLEHTPLDQVLERVFAELGLERPGGASGRGWSSRALFLACPYKYKRLALDGAVVASAPALETGGLLHQLLAIHYLRNIHDSPILDYDKLRSRLLEEGVLAEVVMEAYRLFEAYVMEYDNDYLIPLAVERLTEDGEGNTCRYDLICSIGDNNDGLPIGTVVCEHKTAARFDQATLDGWQNDGQIVQQMLIWNRARLARKYGRLQGVLVNLIGKQKVPEFRRLLIPPQAWQIKGHVKDLRVWEAMESFFESTGTWPRNRNSCVGRYGKCSLFTECAGA